MLVSFNSDSIASGILINFADMSMLNWRWSVFRVNKKGFVTDVDGKTHHRACSVPVSRFISTVMEMKAEIADKDPQSSLDGNTSLAAIEPRA